MKITQYKDKTWPFIVVDDFYTKDQQDSIFSELDFLKRLLTTENQETGSPSSATDSKGNVLVNLQRLYLDQIYRNNRHKSSILRHYKKFFQKKVLNAYKIVPSWVTYKTCNYDISQVNYYEDGNYYKKHYDVFQHTGVVWFFKEPKKFKGGEFVFTGTNQVVECKHNRMVLFPSYYFHKVNKVKMKKADAGQDNGRYSLTHFFSRK